MVAQDRRDSIQHILGLSNRSTPVQLKPGECPDLLNIELSNRIVESRNGYERLHESPMRIGSARLDGVNDYIRIPHVSAFGSPTGLVVGVAIQLLVRPVAETVFLSKGFGTGADLVFSLSYDPTINTNAGGWRGRIGLGASGVSVTVNDGVVLQIPKQRYLVLSNTGVGSAITLSVYDDEGTLVGTGTGSAASTIDASTADIFVGVNTTALNTIGSTFANCRISEIRFAKTASTDLVAASTTRELDPQSAAYTACVGYWKLNDGTRTGFLTDTKGASNGVAPQQPAEWILDQTKVIGQSALKFNGGSSWIRLDAQSQPFPTAPTLSSVFADSTTLNSHWTLRGVFTPLIPSGATTVPDQTIIWFGGAANPAPVGVRIQSNLWEFVVRDGSSNVVKQIGASGGTDPTSLAGTKVRWMVTRYRPNLGGSETIHASIAYFSGSTILQANSTTTTLGSAAPDAVSNHIAVGQHIQAASATAAFTVPYATYTSGGDGPMYGILDAVQLVWHPGVQPYIGLGGPLNDPVTGPFTEYSQWSTINSTASIVFDMRLNDQAGNIIYVGSQPLTNAAGQPNGLSNFRFVARLIPEPDNGLQWDVGMVDPWEDIECPGAFQYNRFLADGTRKTSLVALNGSTFYVYDDVTEEFVPAAGGIVRAPAGAKATAAVYGQRLYIALPNGLRPYWWDGKNLRLTGIEAPLSPLAVTTSAGGGTFNGTYWFYVTYVNKDTGDESNPSPGIAKTFAGPGDKISAIELPVSPDGQVNCRRVYMTAASGADGDVAYPLVDINDNTTTTYSVAQTTPATIDSGAALIYLDNDAAPAASIVAAFHDTVFAGGNSQYPTRVWRSSVGYPTAWNQSSTYVDLDLDIGNPVSGALTLNQFVVFHLRNGYALLWNTGGTVAPIGFNFSNRDHGAVGPQCLARNNSQHIFVTARDIFESDGTQDRNLSSPDNPMYPSIEETMRSGLNASRLSSTSCANYRAKKQYWVCTSSTGSSRNDRVYVLSSSLGITSPYYESRVTGLWSVYDLPVDTIAEWEDASGSARLYGVIRGYLCRLDTGDYDGIGQGLQMTTTGGDTRNIEGLSLSADVDRGMRISIYHRATDTIEHGVVADVNADLDTITLFDALDAAPASGDVVWVGAIPWFFDLILSPGVALYRAVMHWLQLFGESDDNDNRVRVSWKVDAVGRTWNYTNVSETTQQWLTSKATLPFRIGGLMNGVRIRIASCGLTSARSEEPVPMVTGRPKIYSVDYEMRVTRAK